MVSEKQRNTFEEHYWVLFTSKALVSMFPSTHSSKRGEHDAWVIRLMDVWRLSHILRKACASGCVMTSPRRKIHFTLVAMRGGLYRLSIGEGWKDGSSSWDRLELLCSVIIQICSALNLSICNWSSVGSWINVCSETKADTVLHKLYTQQLKILYCVLLSQWVTRYDCVWFT